MFSTRISERVTILRFAELAEETAPDDDALGAGTSLGHYRTRAIGPFVSWFPRKMRFGIVGAALAPIMEQPAFRHTVAPPRRQQLIYSWLCISGSREVSCRSIIMLMRRSSWKKVAAFLPGSTFRKIGTYFCRSCAAEMSVSNQRRMRLSA